MKEKKVFKMKKPREKVSKRVDSKEMNRYRS
jgi:hypothetical protein